MDNVFVIILVVIGICFLVGVVIFFVAGIYTEIKMKKEGTSRSHGYSNPRDTIIALAILVLLVLAYGFGPKLIASLFK